MKILYIAPGNEVDYQNDCLLIGLKEILGADVVDINKHHHIYVTYDDRLVGSLYGKGMTVTKILPDLEVDRGDVIKKINNQYYDLVVYGSIHRCTDYIDDILKVYPKNKIIVVDGEDIPMIHPIYYEGIPYFKREIHYPYQINLFPISFAIPTCKVNFNKNKTRNMAFITPLDLSTYIYDKESDYYNDYSQSRFGITCRKGGWDCMRHYEILANGCLPVFIDINELTCPYPKILTTFPQDLCREVLARYEDDGEACYSDLCSMFEDHLMLHNTTERLADKFINEVARLRSDGNLPVYSVD